MTDSLPLVEPLDPPPDPVAAFLALSTRPHCLFLDSAAIHPELGRYSFVAADPFAVLLFGADRPGALERLENCLRRFEARSVPDVPPFQGGAAGLFSYDLGRQLEVVPPPRYDEFRVPVLALGLYDVVTAFDHLAGRCWIISQGFPERRPTERKRRAEVRAAEFRRLLQSASSGRRPSVTCGRLGYPRHGSHQDVLPAEQLAPHYPVPFAQGMWSNFSHRGYLEAVQQVIDYIYAGDVFQVNLSQRLITPARDCPIDLYLRLRRRNPAPFAGYFDLGRFQILSASPERFLRLQGGRVETRPIKGTCRRTGRVVEDAQSCERLLRSEKDRAENVMIVDLLRNDLSRVCLPESIRVAKLCGLEQYQFVYHLVSVVTGRLRPECGPIDLVRAAFPGGSITGAPKIRAMEIIAELEPTARGPYCGCLGYIGFDGAMDLNILIRTIVAGRGWWQASVGGGVVSQSDPQREYEETWEKAEGLLHALR